MFTPTFTAVSVTHHTTAATLHTTTNLLQHTHYGWCEGMRRETVINPSHVNLTQPSWNSKCHYVEPSCNIPTVHRVVNSDRMCAPRNCRISLMATRNKCKLRNPAGNLTQSTKWDSIWTRFSATLRTKVHTHRNLHDRNVLTRGSHSWLLTQKGANPQDISPKHSGTLVLLQTLILYGRSPAGTQIRNKKN